MAASKRVEDKSASKAARNLPVGKGFDFWVLALSWSPSYCAVEGEDANRQQCDGGRPYGFVVHGLWPQFEKGWPENCGAQRTDLPDSLVRSLYDIMPSAGLIRYQWTKHGGCSGLSAEDYFTVLRAARERIVVPPPLRQPQSDQIVKPSDVESAFLSVNPGMVRDGVAVTCDDEYLREIRICMSKELSLRSCREVGPRDCRRSTVAMPAIEAR